MFFQNIPFEIFHIPINRVISTGGVGVDFFFVISGFCMYLTFDRRYPSNNLAVIIDFVKNRWLRIAPAFYSAVIFYSIIQYLSSNHFPLKELVLNCLFIQTFGNGSINGPHFWSLATEWHFYLILPVLFYLGRSRLGIYTATALLMVLCVAFRLIHWRFFVNSFFSIEDYDKIYFRFVEFGWGIIACKYYIDGGNLPRFFRGLKGFVVAFGIAYSGRLMNTTEVITMAKSWGFTVKAFSDVVMTFGFSLVLLNALSSHHALTKLLNLRIFQEIGKISYSFYLWHWVIGWHTCHLFVSFFGKSNLVFEMSFVFSTVITCLIARMSFLFVELRFYRAKKIPLRN